MYVVFKSEGLMLNSLRIIFLWDRWRTVFGQVLSVWQFMCGTLSKDLTCYCHNLLDTIVQKIVVFMVHTSLVPP